MDLEVGGLLDLSVGSGQHRKTEKRKKGEERRGKG